MLAKINNNLIKVNDINIPAVGLIPAKAIIRDISFSNKVDADGKRTDEVEAVRYDFIDPETFSTFTIKVTGSHPVITKADLAKSETPIYLEIPVDQVTIKPYKYEYGKLTVSITAPSVKLSK